MVRGVRIPAAHLALSRAVLAVLAAAARVRLLVATAILQTPRHHRAITVAGLTTLPHIMVPVAVVARLQQALRELQR
jgi:hypothetical protein